jgi:SAM-dependent methyltransferase
LPREADIVYSPPAHAFPSTFQFERTRALRASVYREARLSLRKLVLDVGAGEGLVAEEIAARTGRPCLALDLTPGRPVPPGVRAFAGDAEHLPFRAAALDAVAFQFVLLWVPNPMAALREAVRLLKPGGAVMILAEPDLTSRVDEPDTGLGRAIVRATEIAGGHPDAGARVETWLREAGLRPKISSTLAEWAALTDPAEAEHELAFLEERAGLLREEVLRMAELELSAAQAGTRRVLLPLYYGVGIKPGE